MKTLRGHEGFVAAVAITSDGKKALSAGRDRIVRLWDLVSGNLIRSMKGHEKAIWSVAFSPDEKTALSGGGDEVLRHWDLSTGLEISK